MNVHQLSQLENVAKIIKMGNIGRGCYKAYGNMKSGGPS